MQLKKEIQHTQNPPSTWRRAGLMFVQDAKRKGSDLHQDKMQHIQ